MKQQMAICYLFILCILLSGCSFSLFRSPIGSGNLPNIPSTPAIVTPTTPVVQPPATPLTNAQEQVKIDHVGWLCLWWGLAILILGLALAPAPLKLRIATVGGLLCAVWVITDFLSWLVPYKVYIGAAVVTGGSVWIGCTIWKWFKETVMGAETLHGTSFWDKVKAGLMSKQSKGTQVAVKKVTPASVKEK